MTKTKQTKVNFYTNILALLANIVVGIYYTPYLLDNLGLLAYGVLPLALIINQYISVVTQTLTHSYTRFYSVALQKEDYEAASKNISTSFIVTILIALCILPIAWLLVNNVDRVFNIPSDLLLSAQSLFSYTILSFICSLFSSLFNVTLYAINKLDLLNVIKIVRAILKLVLVIILFNIYRIDVSLVGIANLISEIVILLFSIYLFLKFKPIAVRVSIKLFDISVLYAILGMSVWVLIQVCGDTLIYRTDNLILNAFWDVKASGALGAISEIGSYVTVIVSVVGSLFGPLILISYSKGEHDEVKSLLVTQSTIVGSLSAILSGVISGFAVVILDVWLGNDMGQYSWWLVLKMMVLPYFAAGGIMAFVYRAWNRVKFPAIGTILIGFADVIVLIFICKLIKPASPLIILVVSAGFAFIQCFLLNAIAVSKLYPEVRSAFIKIFYRITLVYFISYLCSKVFANILTVSSIWILAFSLLFIGVILLLIVYFMIYNKEERSSFVKILK